METATTTSQSVTTAAPSASAEPALADAATSATSTASATSAEPSGAWLIPIDWPAQADLLEWTSRMGPATACVLVMLGGVYLMLGIRCYKLLLSLNAAVIGAVLGAVLGERADAMVVCVVLGAIGSAAVTWPAIKYSVVVQGGVTGAVLGATIWNMAGLEPGFAWTGAMVGLVFCGMLSFVLFSGSVMLYMSVQGAAMLICGLLGLAMKYPNLGTSMLEHFTATPYLLPLMLIIPAIVGLVYQHTLKAADDAAAKKKLAKAA